MKPFLLFVLLVITSVVPAMHASSFAALGKPSLSILEAVQLAQKYVTENTEGGETYYVFKAECGYYGQSDSRAWLIGFAQPGGAYYFVRVYMDKTIVKEQP